MIIQSVASQKAPAAIGPYAQATTVDGWVFTSGQIPLNAAGDMVEGGIESQVRQVLQNLDAVLEAAQVGRHHVVKATIYMTNLGHFTTVNEAYGAYFGEHRPARSTVQVAALPRGAQVEIEFVAKRP